MPHLNLREEFAPERGHRSRCLFGAVHSAPTKECTASKSGRIAPRRSGDNSPRSSRNGVYTETDGGGRGVALRIECHRCQIIRTGRLDASVTAAWLPIACLALQHRAQHAVLGAPFGALNPPAAAAAGDVLMLSPAQWSQPRSSAPGTRCEPQRGSASAAAQDVAGGGISCHRTAAADGIGARAPLATLDADGLPAASPAH